MTLKPKPDWFEATFTDWEHPTDIPCTKTPGRRAETVLEAIWSFSPGSDRRSEYQIARNRGLTHWILWESTPVEGEVFTVPVAYGPCRGPNGEKINAFDAATHLLVAAWAGEDDTTDSFCPPMEARGLLEGEEFDAICREVWPSLYEDVPAE